MKNFLLLFIFTLSISTLNAQYLDLGPVQGNPALQKAVIQKQSQRDRALISQFGISNMDNRNNAEDCENNADNFYVDGESLYVLSGNQVKICIDTVGFDTVKCTNCDAPVFGNVMRDTLSTVCFYYNSDAGTIIEEEELFFQKCNDTGNEDLTITVVIKRPGTSYIQAESVLNPGSMNVLCANNLNLPDNISFSTILDCNSEVFGEAFDATDDDNCIMYEANRFAGRDTICVEFCDLNCICDTAFLTVQIEGDTLGIPFFEDFSYTGPFPDQTKWLDDNVYVNNHFGYQSPSIGVATFDGLDQTGTPYGGEYGRADILTSNYLALDQYSNSDGLYLNFHYQNKGWGYQSNREDSLIVEFRNQSGEWDQVVSIIDIRPYPPDSIPPFMDTTILINDSDYFYDGFQFRFVAHGIRLGIHDLWHVDYIVLDDRTNADGREGFTNDLAFNQVPDFILKNYSSMPVRQFDGFEAQELLDEQQGGVYNNFRGGANVNSSSLRLFDETNNQLVYENPSSFLTNIPGNVDSKTNVNFLQTEAISGPVISSFVPGLEELDYNLSFTLRNDNQNSGFSETFRNDTVSSVTSFNNVLAYDDGTAEQTGSIQALWQAAVKFVLNKPDTLQAIQIMHPHFKDAVNIQFNLLVWKEKEDDPIYTLRNVSPFYTDVAFDSLQGYTTYLLVDENGVPSSIPLEAGNFHIGWEQPQSVTRVQIGADRNSIRGQQNIFINDNFSWNVETFPISLCIRAVLGGERPLMTSVQENPIAGLTPKINIYPNPSNGLVNFDVNHGQLSDYHLEIFNISGQLLLNEPLTAQKILKDLGNGLFFARITDLRTNISVQQKLFIHP